MKVNFKPMGGPQTNCYIVTIDNKDLIIDPGMGATQWVLENTTNPIAILNTHGHYDHVWSNKELKEALNIPIYTPKEDRFMLIEDTFLNIAPPPSEPDIEIIGDTVLDIEGIKVEYLWMPGHTKGCSIIIINDCCFSGDFIFENSIGRVDFGYSNPEDMKKSIKKFLAFDFDKKVYPGHGNPTTIKTEQGRIGAWLNYI